jgi:hypothetical protein
LRYRDLRIVIGEGPSIRNGFFRFVLEGEGFDVAAEATSVEELSGAIAEFQPDVIVLDDMLGVAGLELVQQEAPRAKIVVVWPAAVQPVGADARVDPSSVLRELGTTVERVGGVGPGSGLTGTFDRPDWIGKVRKDPAMLREILATGKTSSRPSISELQRANRETQPTADAPAAADLANASSSPPSAGSTGTYEVDPEQGAAEVTDVPALTLVGPVNAEAGPDVETPGLVDALETGPRTLGTTAEERASEREWNRKLGGIALGAAAVAGAVLLSFALGGTPVHVAGEAPGAAGGTTLPGPIGISLDKPTLHVGHHIPSTRSLHTLLATGGGVRPTSGPGGTGHPGPGPGPGPGTGGGDGGGGDGGGRGGGGDTGTTPGHSGDHNPHGGPPGQTGDGPGNGHAYGHGNGNGGGNGHAHGDGNGNGDGDGGGSSHGHGHAYGHGNGNAKGHHKDVHSHHHKS